jgi:hypothetical protein
VKCSSVGGTGNLVFPSFFHEVVISIIEYVRMNQVSWCVFGVRGPNPRLLFSICNTFYSLGLFVYFGEGEVWDELNRI